VKGNKKSLVVILIAVIFLIGYLLVYIKPDRYYDDFQASWKRSIGSSLLYLCDE